MKPNGDGSVGKALPRVQVPNTHIKSQAQCCVSEIAVWCVGWGWGYCLQNKQQINQLIN